MDESAGHEPWRGAPRWIGDLTERQVEILRFVHTQIRSRGYAPSMREIGREMGMTSPSSVKYQLHVLELRGYIRRDPKTSSASA